MAVEDPRTGRFEEENSRMAPQATNGETEGIIDEAVQMAMHQARQTRDDFMDAAGERAKSFFSDQKDRAADGLEDLAHAFKKTGDALREQEYASAAYYAEMAADKVERVSGYLREGTMEEFIDDAEKLMRRQPALVIGGALTLGFLAARLLTGSVRESRARTTGRERGRAELSGSYSAVDHEVESTPYGAH